MRKIAYLLTISFLIIAGCGEKQKAQFTAEQMDLIPPPQKTNLPPASGGFVIAVGDETITAEQIIEPLVSHFAELARNSSFETFSAQAAPQIDRFLTTQISNILLYQMAKKDAADNMDEALEKEAEKIVREFVVSFGGDYAKAEQELKKMGMDWEKFKEYQKRIMLSQSYISSQLPEYQPPTYTELLEYYNKVKDRQYITPELLHFQLIDIIPEKIEITDPCVDHLETARQLANQALQKINAGEDFGAIAKEYSHGYRKDFAGQWNPVHPNSLAQPYDILAAEAQKIEPGQTAGPIETKGHIFIMKLKEKRKELVQPFEQVQNQIEAKISFEKRKQVIDELSMKLVSQAAIGNKAPFVAYCSRRIYEIANE